MRKIPMKTALGSFTLTLIVAGTLIAGTLNAAGRRVDERERFDGRHGSGASTKKDADNPSARAQWQDEWYNESYVANGRKTTRQGGNDNL